MPKFVDLYVQSNTNDRDTPESEEFFVWAEVPRFGGEAVEGAPVRLQEELPPHQRLVRRLEAHLKQGISLTFTGLHD